jgi:perosamine synthetase
MNTWIPLFDCRLDETATSVAASVLASGQIATGPKVAEFEAALSARLRDAEVVAVSDSTHAQTLAMMLAGVRPGDEVMSLAYTCLSSSSAIANVGAIPVWVDLDPVTARISLEDCASALTGRTRAVVAYHVAGYPAPMADLRAFCIRNGLALIEDANNALGANVDGAPVGTWGDFATLSFYANRQVNGIDGGAVVLREAVSRSRADRLRRYGIDEKTFRDPEGEISQTSGIPEIGMSATLNHLHAAVAICQLGSLDTRLERCRNNAKCFTEAFANLTAITPVAVPAESEPVYWTFLLRASNPSRLRRELRASGIASSALHLPNDFYSGFGASARILPGTRRFSAEVVAIPCGWWLSDDDVTRVISAVCRA